MSDSYSNPKFRYRPDIDGLRALAVLPVLLYHLGLGCPGGYVGVDVFFVISGFLITSIILREAENGSFSMLKFWERRIRRIVPALAVVVLITVVVAAFVFYPPQFRPFGKELIAQTTMVSNFYFWLQDGYFAPLSEHQPLLHTWSLSVEEQFYFIFPILLTFLLKKRKALSSILIIAAGSFLWSIYGTNVYAGASFYLLPARAWELLLGSILAMSITRVTLPRNQREITGILGLLLILLPVFYYTSSTPFPGLAALPPCLGAFLIIASNIQGQDDQSIPLTSQFLSLPPIVWVGKISYSLYLWHWPMIAFLKYASIDEPSVQLRLIIMLSSIPLAWLSWRFVEAPFRGKTTQGSHKKAFKLFGFITVLFIALGAIIYKMDGIPSRFSAATLGYAVTVNQKKIFKDTVPKIIANKQLTLIINDRDDLKPLPILVWGDSHARSTIPLFRSLCEEYQANIYIAHQTGTRPILGVIDPPRIPDLKFNQSIIDLIKNQQIKHVVLIARWDQYSDLRDPFSPEKPSIAVFDDGLKLTVTTLHATGIKVWIMKQVPMQKVCPPRFLANAYRYNFSENDYLPKIGVTIGEHLKSREHTDRTIDALTSLGAQVLDPLTFFANDTGYCSMEADGHSLYYDFSHLSEHGALWLKPLFVPLFEQPAPLPDNEPQ